MLETLYRESCPGRDSEDKRDRGSQQVMDVGADETSQADQSERYDPSEHARGQVLVRRLDASQLRAGF